MQVRSSPHGHHFDTLSPLIQCPSQAAPPPLRRCKIYAGQKWPPKNSDPTEQRLGLQLQWERTEHEYVYWPGANSSASIPELYDAARGFAAARGVPVALEEQGNCLVFDLA